MALPYKRNPDYIKQHLSEQNDGSVLTDTPCRLLVPERYISRHLAVIGADVYVMGFWAILMGEYYAVSRTLAMQRILPSSIEKVELEGMVFIDFHFQAGDTVIANTNLVQNNTLAYYAYDELIAKGNIPWYYDYFDIAKFFDTDIEFAGLDLGNPAVLELIISTMARDSKDKTRLYRHIFNKPEDLQTNPPVITPFRSVIWNTSDTTSKLIGPYPNDSIVSALVNPNEKTERIEELLRT